MRNTLLTGLLASTLSLPLAAAEMHLQIEIPRLQTAEYHRPYVAIWIETANGSHVADLAVWYDLAMRDREGEKWLKDMRLWWRRSGRNLAFPVDGLSAATRAPGQHSLRFDSQHPALASLPAGDYRLQVEAARELGGRELLQLPFSWPPGQGSTDSQQGQHELGRVHLELTP